MRTIARLLSLALLLVAAPALAQQLPSVEAGKEKGKRAIDFDLEVTSLFALRNDGDFDRTEPIHSEFGQAEGFLATFLHPFVQIRSHETLRFFYETEIGMDLWSEKNPDHWLGVTGASALSIKQRQIFGEAAWDEWYVRAGYQRLEDTSGLFVNHWVGALRGGYGLTGKTSGFRLTVGQLPDQTHEGWTWGDSFNNFNSDVILAAAEGRLRLNDHLALDGGGYYLFDGTIARQERHLGAAGATFKATFPSWKTALSAIAQFGTQTGAGVDGSDIGIFGWAAQWTGQVRFGMVELLAGAVAISADDSQEGNDRLGFVWSGKRASRSMLLSENELRDIGDNIDERMAVFDGMFWEPRMGLAGADLSVRVTPLPWLQVGALTEGLFALNPDNAMGESFIGWENELTLDLTAFDGDFRFHLAGGMLLPGGAAAAHLNLIDREATDNLYFVQSAILMYF
jgi:hypothetical protein